MGDQALQLINGETSTMSKVAPDSESLFLAHHERIFRAAYRVSGSVQDAEDVLQAVFLRILKQNEDAKVGNDPGSYLCRAAINASLDILRSRGRRQMVSLDEREDEIDLLSPPTDIEVHRSEDRRQLRAAIATLSQREAEIFSLRHFEDFKNNEIAEMIGISSSSVAVTLHRAREKLQELLREFEGGKT